MSVCVDDDKTNKKGTYKNIKLNDLFKRHTMIELA